MNRIFFLVLRRMRTPLLSLILVNALAMAGLALIPAQDGSGQPVPMSLFHAFYFVSYMSTTIGFGEIPNAFTDAQRLWVSISVFATVGVWVYAIGALIALLQDPALQRTLAERRFRARVRRLREPFYLVCGYGQTGSALVRGLTDRHRRAVVIDIDPERINLLQLDNQREYVPALAADARHPDQLDAAGLRNPLCRGVVALTNVNETNLKIAIAAKLMHPNIQVICRADSHEIEANMASFGTDRIYDPFDTFALYMSLAIQAPGLTLLHDWLSGFGDEPLNEPLFPPRQGRWVVCGYGRFGKAMYRYLKAQKLSLTVIESSPQQTGVPSEGVVKGRGTEAATLEQAQIQEAVGLVAGTDNDADNLSIIMTALALNPELFVVARENHLHNSELFDRVGAQAVMHPSTVIADRIRMRLGTPLLAEFLTLARHREDAWACVLVSRILGLVEDRVPRVWEIRLDAEEAPALCALADQGTLVNLSHLLRDPRDRAAALPAIALLLDRPERRELLPAPEMPLRPGDRLLFCGREGAQAWMTWTLGNLNVLRYVLTGASAPDGWVWRWWAARRRGA